MKIIVGGCMKASCDELVRSAYQSLLLGELLARLDELLALSNASRISSHRFAHQLEQLATPLGRLGSLCVGRDASKTAERDDGR
jgi:hypothetical protein